MTLIVPTSIRLTTYLSVVWFFVFGWLSSKGQEAASNSPANEAEPQTMYVQEYRVIGARKLERRDVEKAVYPFLGPERTPADVDKARAALEKAYREKGYETVSVLIPEQKVKKGVVMLEVVEVSVGRLRVHGSRYYDIEKLKQKVPSLGEGSVPNASDINRDLLSINQQAGLRVTPVSRPGLIPGTVDIDLNVKDENPLHGSLEINNRYSTDTSPWRINGDLRYTNLWQLGHTLGASFQIAPERLEDSRVFSGFYMLPVPGQERWTLTFQAMTQQSKISSLGVLNGTTIIESGGEVLGLRASARLPAARGLYHSLSFGLDYKNFNEDLTVAGTTLSSPVTYYPISLNYLAVWASEKSSTELNAGVILSLRGQGADTDEFANKRYNADDGFFYFRGDISHTRQLKSGFEAYGKIQGQASSGPLINNEQLAGGGLGSVRGYLESTALGDNGVFGTVELRSPSLLKMQEDGNNEWRFYVFADGGRLTLNDPLPEQDTRFDFASVGIGSRFRVLNHLNGSIDAGLPLIKQSTTDVGELLFTVRFWADF